MSTYRWRVQEERLLQTLLPTNTHREISEQIKRRHDKNISGFPCERTEKAVSRKCEREGWDEEACADFGASDPQKKRWQEIADLQKEYEAASTPRYTGVNVEASVKILSLSDIHFPLARVDLLAKAINDHADADIVVVNGDLMEGYIFSVFEKSKSIAALDEYRTAFKFVMMLSKKFPKVVLVDGNHDIRASRALKQQGFGKAASQILRPNLMARIANGEVLDESGMLIEKLDFSNVIYEQRESWFVKIGKTLFIHPHGRGGSKPGHTVTNHGDKLIRRYEKGEVDSVVCGHTHKMYKGIINGVMYVEQGMLAGLLSYLHQPKNDYRFNYQNGYAVVYQDKEGNTDFNRSGPVYLGESLPPKKEAL